MHTPPLLIAGPCAADSPEVIAAALSEAASRRLDFVRTSLWKPRTKPGFEGPGYDGLPYLKQAVEAGLNPATEVLLIEHAERILADILPILGTQRLLLWLGARNQNHLIQREVSRLAASDPRVFLMMKNPPWRHEEHWLGTVEHALAGGIAMENLILCHRGFVPGSADENPRRFRNLPDYELAMKVRQRTGLKMLFDPSHTGGTQENVIAVTKEAAPYDFDGLIIEVHPDPATALTDAKQQLKWAQFDSLVSSL